MIGSGSSYRVRRPSIAANLCLSGLAILGREPPRCQSLSSKSLRDFVLGLELKGRGPPVNGCSRERSWLFGVSSVHQLLHVCAGCRRWRGPLLHASSHCLQSVVLVESCLATSTSVAKANVDRICQVSSSIDPRAPSPLLAPGASTARRLLRCVSVSVATGRSSLWTGATPGTKLPRPQLLAEVRRAAVLLELTLLSPSSSGTATFSSA